jgi:hypothetical protein
MIERHNKALHTDGNSAALHLQPLIYGVMHNLKIERIKQDVKDKT